jgi:hypothetical protein
MAAGGMRTVFVSVRGFPPGGFCFMVFVVITSFIEDK